MGFSRAMPDGKPLVYETVTERIVSKGTAGARAALSGRYALEDGRFAVPSFQLLAEKYLDERYAPEAVAAETGIAADIIRGLAAEIARVAFDEAIFIDQPWTDMNGERHDGFIGRPVSFHAMRGLSAHSNGFQTARALHMLQVLIGAVDCPGAFRFEPPYPKPVEAHPTPHGKAEHFGSNKPLSGPHLGFPRGPEDMLIDAAGKPIRIDKAFSWDAPIAAHGLMHMVIANAHAGDPYPIDVLFLYMANMAWNSSMNTAGVIRMLEDKDAATGEYKIPKIIYSDAYASEMVAYADLVLPDTTYLERHDCISMLDRPISEPDAVQDAIRWPVIEPDRDVRGFQSVLIDLGARLKLPGFVDHRGRALYKDYADYIVRHERRPGIGPLAGFRGPNGDRTGRGAANPDQLKRYIENGSFFSAHIPLEAQFFKHANKAYQDFAVRMGFFDTPQPVTFQLYSETLQKFRLSAEGLRAPFAPETHRQRILDGFDPLPFMVSAVRGSGGRPRGISIPCDHPAAGCDVPFLGFDERLAAADPYEEPALRAGSDLRRARPEGWRLGFPDLQPRPHQGRDRPHGGGQFLDHLDLERDRQAQGRLGARHAMCRKPEKAS